MVLIVNSRDKIILKAIEHIEEAIKLMDSISPHTYTDYHCLQYDLRRVEFDLEEYLSWNKNE